MTMKYALHFGPDSLDIEIEGDFTFQDTRLFHQLLGAIALKDSRSVVRLNVGRLASIDSTALRLLMMAHDEAKKHHRPLIFENARGQVLKRLSEAANYNALNIAA